MLSVSLWFISTAAENEFYKLTTIPFPKELKLEVSGMAALPGDRMAIAIRKGEIWITEKLSTGKPVYKKFASGLHEPLGLALHKGELYTVQRSELTRLRDTDGDGRADEYLTHAKGWGVTGNYHEYAYGPAVDKAGNLWVALNCSIGKGPNPNNRWRGWSLRVKPDGSWSPMSGGFRSPSGIGANLAGDMFATDQQGNWFPTCPLIHVKRGAFHGHADALQFTKLPGATFQVKQPLPKNLTVAEAARRIPAYQLPAVWFPYRKMGMSTTDILADSTRGKFGPFAGQLFCGEFTMSFVSRVFLEKVGGEYQGACFRFRDGLDCAALRLQWGADGSMYIGQSNRGWNSLGTKSYGLQRLQWTGKMPFEIKTMSARADGFVLTFTKPVNRATALNPKSYTLTSYTYPYQSKYGGEPVDVKTHKIKVTALDAASLSVHLNVEGLREGYVYELHANGLRDTKGKPLLHKAAYYTLNRIPK
ncbi:MAG TPA: hypothetical protein EYQ62_07780 [Verrucomicrobiales bacterium]|nr:hypothetical protein [Verrucomicrobiales bacterium]